MLRSLQPVPPKASSVFFSATSNVKSSAPARPEDSFADFMKDLQTLGAFDPSWEAMFFKIGPLPNALLDNLFFNYFRRIGFLSKTHLPLFNAHHPKDSPATGLGWHPLKELTTFGMDFCSSLHMHASRWILKQEFAVTAWLFAFLLRSYV